MEEAGPSQSPTEKTAIKTNHFTQDLSDIPSDSQYFVALLAFLGFCNIYALRANLSVAIVAMTQNKTVNGTVLYNTEFPWDAELRGLVLSSFFYGYIVTQIPGGWLATQMGGKRLFGIGVGVTAFITLITPLLAKASIYLLILGRVFEGLFEGITYPSIHAVWNQWAPPLERSRLATIAFSGSYFGTVVALPLSAFLAQHVGWESIFYVFGVIALCWCMAWWMFVTETPQSDRRITDYEMEYIRSSIGASANHVKNVDPPWKRFFTSLPVWAIMIAHFSENWGFYTLLTELPTFMKDILHFDLLQVGWLSALPYLVMGIVVQIGGFVADWLRSNGHLTTTQMLNHNTNKKGVFQVRKLCNCGAFSCQTLFLVAAAHSSTPAAAISCLTVAVGFGGFAWAGFSVNHLDLAPQFASILMGLSNTVATLPGMISPLLTEHLVQHKALREWQGVFYIAGGIYLAGAVFYGLFASGERQKWADIPDSYMLCRDDHSHASTEDMPFGTGSCE
ncbi:Putative inorganic phosphate cotransporter [Gryllus bimaculatus]|nr:Putative inorganic phosphate cotransporter [Gryllus bimaculatus]